MRHSDLVESILYDYSNYSSFVDVRDFAPNRRLTKSNFDAAIRAAILKAYTLIGTPHSTIDAAGNAGERYANVHVLIPPGQWPVNNTLRFPATYPKYTPGLIGLGGKGSVTLIFDQTTLTGPTIWCGNETPGAELANYTSHQVMKNIEIQFAGDASYIGGIRNRFSYHAHWEDVNISGLTGVRAVKYNFGDWEKRIGLDFGTMDEGYNHQHLNLTRVGAQGCLVGMRLGAATWTCTAQKLNLDGSLLTSAMIEGGASLSWHGGSAQGGFGSVGGSGVNDPHRYARGSVLSTGAAELVASGSGASLGVANDGYSVLTGLSGLIGYIRTHVNTYKLSWIEIENAGYTSGYDLVGGLYRISDILSATSLRMHKGSGHPAVSSNINWRIYGSKGGQHVVLRNVYYEGGSHHAYAYMALGSYESLPDDSYWTVDTSWAWGPTWAVKAAGMNAHVIFKNSKTWHEGIEAERCRFSSFETDLPKSKCVVDGPSRSGLVCRVDKHSLESGPGHIWDGHPRAVRLDRCLKERGAIWGIDTRKASTIARSGADVTTWTDFIGGSVGVRKNAGVAPQYNAADSEFDVPVITINANGVASLQAGFTWNLTSLFPAGKFCCPTILLVGRMGTAAVGGGKNMTLIVGSDYSAGIVLNDGGWFPSGWYSNFWTTELGTSISGAAGVPADTSPHGLITSACMAGAGGTLASVGVVSDTNEYGSGYGSSGGLGPTGEVGFVGGATATLMLPNFASEDDGGDFHIVYAAIFPDPLTVVENRHIIDLVQNELL